MMRRVVVGALMMAAVPLGAAQAYWYPYPYYGYGYAPRPVYVAPVPPPYYPPGYAPEYAAPRYYVPAYAPPPYRVQPYGRAETRRVHRVPVRAVHPRTAPGQAPGLGSSPFSGPGLEGVVPASTGPRPPLTLGPAPVSPPPQPAGAPPSVQPRAAPPNNAYPPESFTPFRGD